jgi:hypothetical protein
MGEPVGTTYRSFAQHRRTLMFPAQRRRHAVRRVLGTPVSAEGPHRRKFVMGGTCQCANQPLVAAEPIAVD